LSCFGIPPSLTVGAPKELVVSGMLVVPLTATTQNVEGGINDDAHLILANRNFQTDSEEVGQLIRVHQTRMNAEPVRS
jgi:hypothetical protein